MFIIKTHIKDIHLLLLFSCESKKLNHIDVSGKKYSSKVCYFDISSSFVTHIVSQNVRDQRR